MLEKPIEGSTVPENTTAPNIIKVLKTTLSMTRFYDAGLIREAGMRVPTLNDSHCFDCSLEPPQKPVVPQH